jgi:hypothetical protein
VEFAVNTCSSGAWTSSISSFLQEENKRAMKRIISDNLFKFDAILKAFLSFIN